MLMNGSQKMHMGLAHVHSFAIGLAIGPDHATAIKQVSSALCIRSLHTP